MKYCIEDTFEVSPERYWEVLFDEDYNHAMYQHLNVDRELIKLERRGEGEDLVVEREQILRPKREIPAFMRKFADGALQYRERDVFTKKTNSMQVENVPNMLRDKLTSRGTYRIEQVEPGKVKRIWDGELTCSIPLVGGKIEQRIVEEVRDDYRKTTEFTRRWLAEHPA